MSAVDLDVQRDYGQLVQENAQLREENSEQKRTIEVLTSQNHELVCTISALVQRLEVFMQEQGQINATQMARIDSQQATIDSLGVENESFEARNLLTERQLKKLQNKNNECFIVSAIKTIFCCKE